MPQENIQKQIPDDILGLIASDEIALLISAISISEDLNEDEIEKVAYQTARVLLGSLEPEQLFEGLRKNEGFSWKISRNIADKIDEHIFSQVKQSLNYLYEKEKPISSKESEISSQFSEEDIYREPIE